MESQQVAPSIKSGTFEGDDDTGVFITALELNTAGMRGVTILLGAYNALLVVTEDLIYRLSVTDMWFNTIIAIERVLKHGLLPYSEAIRFTLLGSYTGLKLEVCTNVAASNAVYSGSYICNPA